MKIFSAQQMKMADAATIQSEQISSLELMERAATNVFNLLHNKLQGSPTPIHVFCGVGNNGGDGLVISRLLLEHGYTVKTYVVNFSDNRSEEFLDNYDRLKAISKEWPAQLKGVEDFPEISKNDIIIDAIFGVGLNRPLVPWVVFLIKHLNFSNCFIVSIDIPSGLYANKPPDDSEGVIIASVTITFQYPKLVFFLPETGIYSRDLEVIDIGLDPVFLSQTPGIAELINKNEAISLYRPKLKFSHKGTNGHCVLIGGSYGKMGSVVLATRAALKTGAGLVTSYIPQCGYDIMQISVPEVMVKTDVGKNELTKIILDFEPTSIGIGIGIGTSDNTCKTFGKFLKKNTSNLIIDADGLNILTKNPEFLKKLPENTILTPHPKELEGLIGKWKDDFDKLDKVKAFSIQYNCIVVIKGANSHIIYKESMFVNNSGNPGMATAGSGDVLTGMITGLMSQGYEPLWAAVFGVYLHGSSADIAVQKTSYEGLVASDIVSHIGDSFLDLFTNHQPKVQE